MADRLKVLHGHWTSAGCRALPSKVLKHPFLRESTKMSVRDRSDPRPKGRRRRSFRADWPTPGGLVPLNGEVFFAVALIEGEGGHVGVLDPIAGLCPDDGFRVESDTQTRGHQHVEIVGTVADGRATV